VSAQFSISNTLGQGENLSGQDQYSQEVWAQQLRKADERADQFKDEVDRLKIERQGLMQKM